KKEAGEHDLRIATIFTFGANEDDEDAQDFLPEEELAIAADPQAAYQSKHTRDKLDEFITDYNKMYGTAFSTKDSEQFQNYFKDISKRLKEREKATFNDDKDRLDLLLVVNMFLTGFDAKKVNTLYVDKNLKHHGLIQSYSRTNRIFGEKKSQGNILAFRNLKEATDKAITLFSNKEAIEEVVLPTYEVIAKRFDEALKELLQFVPTWQSVDLLESEEEEAAFIRLFRALLRAKNVLESYADFSWDDLGIDEDTFLNYQTKYIDLYQKVKRENAKQKTSILNDIDFEVELIHRDIINVAYIIKLLAKLKQAKKSEAEKQRKAIMDLLGSEVQLRSKRELIEKFIDENLPTIDNADNIQDEFEK
ncbi:MAG: type I restriction endonuclease subunit R, EcoR124 family, partial [Flammeovirgaceae bacterium]